MTAHQIYLKQRRRSYWIISLAFVFCFLIPLVYEYLIEIPPDHALKKEEGTFLYSKRFILELANIKGKMMFTCAPGALSPGDCLVGENVTPFIGKSATAWWFDQETYPFVHQNRLVRLVVDGKELISRSKTVSRTERSLRSSPWTVILALSFLVFLFFFVPDPRSKEN